MRFVIAAAAVLLLIQVMLRGRFLCFIINRLAKDYFSLHFEGGFRLFSLTFRARAFSLIFPGSSEKDRVYFECHNARFRIDLVFLFMGRLRIRDIHLEHPFLDYRNRMESYLKNDLLPGRHRIELKNLNIHRGRITVSDETRTPVYRLELKNIQLENADMDVATPVDVFFRAQRGEADIGSGKLEIGTSANIGYIRLRDVTWGEITAVGNAPFMGSRLLLEAFHSGGSEKRAIQGSVGTLGGQKTNYLEKGSMRNTIYFSFEADWNEYRITLDLGLQKLIGEILRTASASVLSTGLVLGGRGVFEILKKQES